MSGYDEIAVVAPLTRGYGPIASVTDQVAELRKQSNVAVLAPDKVALKAIGRNVLDPARRTGRPPRRRGRPGYREYRRAIPREPVGLSGLRTGVVLELLGLNLTAAVPRSSPARRVRGHPTAEA